MSLVYSHLLSIYKKRGGIYAVLLDPDKKNHGIIESIESTEHDWCIGVQWHPEFLITKADKLLIASFIEFSQKKL